MLKDFCTELQVDGVLMMGISFIHKAKHNKIVGHSRPCAYTSFALFDKNSSLVVDNYTLSEDIDMVCSEKKFKLSMGMMGMKLEITEELINEMLAQSRKTVPGTVNRAKQALDKYKSEHAQSAKTKK